ncbi:MAG: PD40 domain-containing protein [Deltaproteobacteria bacterium]|nr:PD40 domain-containing protein [Deltaproteobacteria bacterium]
MYGDCCFTEGKLVLIPIDESGNLGAATTLYEPEYQAANTLNVFYPAFSPDGRWVAFNMALGSSYDNENAQLYVISVDGGEPIPLAAANFAEGITNSWPHWGPLPDDEVFWLAFASKRAYGDIVNDGVTDPSLLQSQIWVAAFRPALAEAGGDPSSPAFWLPNQDPETSNHTSYWGR